MTNATRRLSATSGTSATSVPTSCAASGATNLLTTVSANERLLWGGGGGGGEPNKTLSGINIQI